MQPVTDGLRHCLPFHLSLCTDWENKVQMPTVSLADPMANDPMSQKEREQIRQFTRDHLSDPDNIDAVDQAVVTAICEIFCL